MVLSPLGIDDGREVCVRPNVLRLSGRNRRFLSVCSRWLGHMPQATTIVIGPTTLAAANSTRAGSSKGQGNRRITANPTACKENTQRVSKSEGEEFLNRDMTLVVLESCNRINALCGVIDEQLRQHAATTTEQRPELSRELLQLLNLTNRLLARDLRRDTDFEEDGWLEEKLKSMKHAAEHLVFWYLSDPADGQTPQGLSAGEVANEMIRCLEEVRVRADSIFNHVATVGAVSERDRWMGEADS